MDEISRRRFFGTAGAVAGASMFAPPTLAAQAGGGRPKLTLTAADYVRLMPIATGDVRPAGLDLTWLRGDRNQMLARAMSDPEVHGGETSMAQHMIRVDRGDRSLVAVPVFPLRNFTARDIYVQKGSTLAPADLAGQRLGIYNWAASGAVWYRHFLRYLTKDPDAVKKATWIVGGVDAPANVRVPDPPPPNVSRAPADRALSDLLLDGEIDALLGPLPPKRHHPTDGPIVRLMPDFRAVEQRYFGDTRCYPPQHLLIIRREKWEENPAVGRQLVEAFNESDAKFRAAQRLYPYSSPWLITDIAEAEALMGEDYHAHGLEKNRHVVDTFCQSGFDDGLTQRRVTVEEYFAEFLTTADLQR